LALQYKSSSRTHVGSVRHHNEDACLDRPDLGLWVVADGMGGHAAGDVASQRIVERLAELPHEERLSLFVERVESALEGVNGELRGLAARHEAATIGSTVAALMVRGEHAVCAWAGDSRVYRIRGETLTQITQDHALVADLVERGLLTAEQAAEHPQANLVTRAVGAGDALKLDMEIIALQPGDRFILCSDGLDKELSAEEILHASATTPTQELAFALVELALARGSRDNVTVVTVGVSTDKPATPGDLQHDHPDSEDTLPGFTTGSRFDDNQP